eukprot:TRINITY_DN2053_c0_g1_i1.p2 TRINITY_DN2053_c0_g1~~TRINITY_DN2053_c0_g1_i1.p2  ORF type:complete len:395 (-),score=57.06 TRINITY_DN2053_c0_g1_i1:639-1823(-)
MSQGLSTQTQLSSSSGQDSDVQRVVADHQPLLNYNDNSAGRNAGSDGEVQERRSWVNQLQRFLSTGPVPRRQLRQTGSLNNVLVIQNTSNPGDSTHTLAAPMEVAQQTGAGSSSQSQPADAIRSGSGGIRNPVQMLRTFLGEQSQTGSGTAEQSSGMEAGQHSRKGSHARGGSKGMSQVGSRQDQPICLICFEPLLAEDFESGEAIQLQCSCKGDVAMRHQQCAIRWSKVKGDNICDICKKPILNIPTPSQSAASSEAGELGGDGADGARPGPADYIFDCIRVSWVAMIICILFLNFDLSKAFLSGVVVGLVYMLFCKAINSLHLRTAVGNNDNEGGNEQGEGQEQGQQQQENGNEPEGQQQRQAQQQNGQRQGSAGNNTNNNFQAIIPFNVLV